MLSESPRAARVRGCALAAAAAAALMLAAGCSASVSHSREWQAGAAFATRNFSRYQSWVQSPADWCTAAALSRLAAPDPAAFARSHQFSGGCVSVLTAAGE